jgi:hypothetical protein
MTVSLRFFEEYPRRGRDGPQIRSVVWLDREHCYEVTFGTGRIERFAALPRWMVVVAQNEWRRQAA